MDQKDQERPAPIAEKKKFWDRYRLKKITLEDSEVYIKNAWIAGIVLIVISLSAIILIGQGGIYALVDVIIFTALVYAVYRIKLLGAIALFVYYLATIAVNFYTLYVTGKEITLLTILIPLIFINYFYLGLLGVIKHQMHEEHGHGEGGGWLERKFKLIVGTILVIAILTIIINWNKPLISQEEIVASVVNVLCPYGEQGFSLESEGTGGSGTIITPEGLILTNAHIIPRKKDLLNVPEKGCFVVLPDPVIGTPQEIYVARPIVLPELSDTYDIAFLEIYNAFVDKSGRSYGQYPKLFSSFDDSLCQGGSVRLGEQVRVFGYPVSSGGLSLTITEGVVSSFPGNGLIVTSTKIDEGNSGGLAVDKRGCMIGIPSLVTIGEYESLGVIISVDLILEFIQRLNFIK